mmetsp:Transcript_8288/g.25865  ORF Transcript_8288/g.25865 Transcript_8288/m.25865 type:complete len:230 (+) Transcript_8288:384-1073(+)
MHHSWPRRGPRAGCSVLGVLCFPDRCVYVRPSRPPSELCVARVLALTDPLSARSVVGVGGRSARGSGSARRRLRVVLPVGLGGRPIRPRDPRGGRRLRCAHLKSGSHLLLRIMQLVARRLAVRDKLFAGGALCGRGRHLDARPQRREGGDPPPVAAAGPPFHRGLPAAAPPASRRPAVCRAAAPYCHCSVGAAPHSPVGTPVAGMDQSPAGGAAGGAGWPPQSAPAGCG